MTELTTDEVIALSKCVTQLDSMKINDTKHGLIVSMKTNSEYMIYRFNNNFDDEFNFNILPRSTTLRLVNIKISNNKKWFSRYTKITIIDCIDLTSDIAKYLVDSGRLICLSHNQDLGINLKNVIWSYGDYMPSPSTIINFVLLYCSYKFDILCTYLENLVKYSSFNRLKQLSINTNVQLLLEKEQEIIYDLLTKINTKYIKIHFNIVTYLDCIKGDLFKIRKMLNLGNVSSLNIPNFLDDIDTVLDQENIITNNISSNVKIPEDVDNLVKRNLSYKANIRFKKTKAILN